MYSIPQLAIKYLLYYLGASNGKGHGTHSPFIFDFITRVLNDRSIYPDYARVEGLRAALLKDQRILRVEDLGAGSSTGRSSERSVASIAKHAAKPRKLGQLLYRIAAHYRPDTILELGTSLGITSAYLAAAQPGAKMVTIEGSTAVASLAEQHFREMGLNNIRLIRGDFDQQLLMALEQLGKVDLAFLDGNHRQEPTERYVSQLLPYLHNDSILVLDDIHWSREMEAAWKTVRNLPQVRCTIDLFFIGIVLFREEFHEKQHFVIRH